MDAKTEKQPVLKDITKSRAVLSKIETTNDSYDIVQKTQFQTA